MPRLTLRQRLTWSAHLWKALAYQHHRELRFRFKPMIPPDGVVLDVGAHAGQFTKLFAGMVPQGHVHAFEPGSYALSILRTAISFKGLSNVTIHACGLGDAPGGGVLNVPVKKSGSVGFGLSFTGASQGVLHRIAKEDITIRRLDDVVAEYDIPRVDFIKLDIEGSELRMLAGAQGTLARFSPVLFIELVDNHLARHGHSIAALVGFLNDLGYKPESGSRALHGGDHLFTRRTIS